jgi:hypothetical protein
VPHTGGLLFTYTQDFGNFSVLFFGISGLVLNEKNVVQLALQGAGAGQLRKIPPAFRQQPTWSLNSRAPG